MQGEEREASMLALKTLGTRGVRGTGGGAGLQGGVQEKAPDNSSTHHSPVPLFTGSFVLANPSPLSVLPSSPRQLLHRDSA